MKKEDLKKLRKWWALHYADVYWADNELYALFSDALTELEELKNK